MQIKLLYGFKKKEIMSYPLKTSVQDHCNIECSMYNRTVPFFKTYSSNDGHQIEFLELY